MTHEAATAPDLSTVPLRAVRLTARARRLTDRMPWEYAALAAILLLSIAIQSYRLTDIGHGNLYYAATVRSMLDNWHALFFGSFDAAGFVTVDKPPAGLWLQTGFARVFGFHGLVLLLPQALAWDPLESTCRHASLSIL